MKNIVLIMKTHSIQLEHQNYDPTNIVTPKESLDQGANTNSGYDDQPSYINTIPLHLNARLFWKINRPTQVSFQTSNVQISQFVYQTQSHCS